MGQKQSQEKYRFRWIGKFESKEDEANYIKWRDENGIKAHYHSSNNKSWPKECKITVFATPEMQEQIKCCKWFLQIWNAEPSTEVAF